MLSVAAADYDNGEGKRPLQRWMGRAFPFNNAARMPMLDPLPLHNPVAS